jgi:Protein of unknown function DUF262/Protein of unknown function (DUF1524)
MTQFSVEIAGISLTDLFRNTGRFLVPNYQRPYSWRQKEWKDLANDLMDHWKSQSQFVSDYAMGEIRLERPSEAGGPYLVADGQQRLVTFAILISALNHVLRVNFGQSAVDDRPYLFDQIPTPSGNENIPRITDQISSVTLVLTKIFESPNPDSLDTSHQEQAYRWFVEYLLSKFQDGSDSLLQFRFHILNKLKFTRTISGPGTGQQAFARANSRGKKLDDADLIKFALLNSANHGHDVKLVWENWQEFTTLAKETRINEGKALVLWAATDLAEDANSVRKSEAYDLIEGAAQRAATDGGVASITALLVAFMMSVKRINSGFNSNGELSPSYANISKSKTLRKHKQLTSLAHACRHLSLSDRELVAKALEDTIVVASFAKAFPPDVERLVGRVRSHWRACQGTGDEDFEKGFSLLREFRNELAKPFAIAICHESELVLPPKAALTALLYAEEHCKSKNSSAKRGLLDYSATVEHILPQSLTSELIEDFGTGEQATIDRYRLGNMALLGGPQNSVNGNRPFVEKLPVFDGSNFFTTMVIAKSLVGQGTFLTELSSRLPKTTVWNREKVEERARGLLHILCDALEVDFVEPGEFVPSSADLERSADNRIPQADDPDRMLEILKLVGMGNESVSDVAVAATADKRHAGYYLSALSIIGLVDSDEGNWSLSDEGLEVYSSENPKEFLRGVMRENALMVAWSDFTTTAQKDSFLAKHDISGSTINRRRQTLDSWYAWCVG